MTAKGEKKPDEYADAFVSHPEPELLKIHDPEKFGCSPCHQGNGRATTSVEKAHGNYEHWLWPLFPKENSEAGCQNCHAADMVLASGDVQWQTINNGKDLFRQRGCMGCHRYEGYDKEPEDLNSIGQQIKQIETQKKDNLKQTAYLMKQADAAESNEEANRLNGQAVDLRVANSKLDGRLQQLDFQSHSLMQDMKKVGPNLKDARLKLNKNWIPVWLKKPTDFRPTTKMPNFRLNDHQIQAISAYHLAVGIHRSAAQTQAGQRRARKRIIRNPRMPGLPLDWRRRSDEGRNVCRESVASWRKSKLRLSGALDSQRARAYAAVLPVRKEGYWPGRLRQEGPSLSVRSRSQPVSQRRARTASPEHDGDAESAAVVQRMRRTLPLSDDAEEAGSVVVCRCLVHG
jgi:cytochrome c551/c552